MDHHHHLHSHGSRYVPVPQQQQPPAPVFLPPDTYRRQPQLAFPPQPPVSVPLPRGLPLHSAAPHHPPDGDFVYVSCSPSSGHASDNHGSRLLGPPNLPERLVVKVPQHPALAGVRVSDRIIFPDGHPEATRVHHHPRRSGDEAFVREGFKRERVRMHDGVQGTLSIGRRMGETVELTEEEEGDAARRLGLPGRKRARWGEGHSLGEDPLFDGFHQERDPNYRFSSGPSPTRRRFDVIYDLRKVDEDLSRDSSRVFVPERKEAMITFPGPPPPEMPLRSPAYSVSKLEFLGESQMAEFENLSPGSSHGLRERSSMGRGKRYVSASEEVFGPVNKAPQQKPSVLTRIQFSKPVCKRKYEQQIVSVTSPLSRPFPFSEGNRFKRDVPAELDVSFKSDALVANEILTSQVSVTPRSFGDARPKTTKKDVIMVTRVSPTRSFSKSGCKVTSTHSHKLKIRQERFAPASVEKKRNRKMAPQNLKVNETLASSNSFENFGVVTPLRTQWNTMASEVSTSLDHKLSSVIREAPDRLTEKKMTEKIVGWQDLDVQDHGAKVTSARSLDKKKQTEELVISQGNTTSNSSENNSMKTVRKLNDDVSLTMEQCPTGGIFKDNLANSGDVQPGGIGIVNRTGGSDMNLENEILLGPKVISLHGSEKVTSVIDLKKEVLGNMPPPASIMSDAKKKTVIARSKEKQDRNTFNPVGSAVNSDRKITRTKLLKKKTIKKKKNKKLFSSVNPCSSNVVSTREIINEHMPAINSVELLEKNESESTLACFDIQKQYQEGASRDSKHSETVKNVSGVGSSTEMKVIEGRDEKFIAVFAEEISSKVRSPKEEEVKGRDTREFTLISCALDYGRIVETCGKPLLNTYSERQMHSCDVQIGLSDQNCTEETRKEKLLGEEVNMERLVAGDMMDSSQDISPLENVHDTSEMIMDSGLLRKCYEQHILSSPHDDAIQQAVLMKNETCDVDASSLNIHLGETSSGHLDACHVAVSSCAIDPIKIDAEESPKKSFGMHSLSNQKGLFQQDQSRQCCDMNLMEDYECNNNLLASEWLSLPDDEVNLEQVQNERTTFFEEESAPKSKSSIPIAVKRQKSSPIPQLNTVQEVLEMVCDMKNVATSLHSPVQGKTVPLQGKAETGVGVPELENERKSLSPVQGAIVTGNEFGEVGTASDTVATKRLKDLHVDAPGLALEFQGAHPCVNLLIETDRRHDSAPNLPCMDAFSQASTSTVRVDYSVVNTIAGPGSDRSDSSLLSVSSRSSHEQLVSADKEIPISGHILDNTSGLGINTTEQLFNGSNDEDDSRCLSLAEYDSCGKSEPTSQLDFLNLGKTVPQQTQGAEKQANCHQLMDKEKLAGIKVCQRPGSSKTYPNQKIPSTRTYRKPPPHSIRLNKWYRTENPPLLSLSVPVKLPGRSSQKQSPKKHGKTQSSYIRKGNSLIRKSSAAMPSSRLHLEQTVVEQTHMLEKSRDTSSEEKNVTNCMSLSSERILNNSFERPKTPPLPLLSKPIHPSSNNQILTENSISETARESNSIPSLGAQRFDLTEENHSIPTQEESKISGKRKVIYVKHRSNQLIAAPSIDANNSSAHTTDETPALSFSTPDVYYRDKNKLIRDTSSSDGLWKKDISLPNDCTDAKHGSSVMSSLKDDDNVLCKARLRQGDASIAKRKMCKRSRFSLVWTLGGLRSQDEKNYNALKNQMALPLFPWKRSTYWKGSIANRRSNLTKHSLPLISRNPQLSRQRNTIYTVSKSGFSLRKSGILGVGGAHLKWSKSMEKRSRKASKDATLAIVECEKKKKKQKHAVSSDPTTKSENCSQHEQMPPVANNQLVNGVKMPIIPRRLLIGNDEYIQIGNGNQLVRDPKKLVRILASEKIRWSLHTARLRAVKKQQYCQFFTRFGKCNKEDGKCPYIHDSTKIAICTKFLKGLCSDANCKLTHKVIPERMPDCSYFLQGLCTNVSCPYRHVNVNPKAAICEGFLKGYCRDDNEELESIVGSLSRRNSSPADVEKQKLIEGNHEIVRSFSTNVTMVDLES